MVPLHVERFGPGWVRVAGIPCPPDRVVYARARLATWRRKRVRIQAAAVFRQAGSFPVKLGGGLPMKA
jgi:hypothetical protein